MTRFVHDQFAKDYLKELLSPIGDVEISRDVSGEVREIDVWFTPKSSPSDYLQRLGLLGQLARTAAIFEPFRNAVTPSQIRSCMGKLFDVHAELERQAKREGRRLDSVQLPHLWILTPTASSALLEGFNFRAISESSDRSGVYVLGSYWLAGLVAIHQLPRTSETLWVRILGKGGVQKQAIQEVAALPAENSLRENALELLYNLQVNLTANQELETEDRELIMALAPLYRQQLNAAIQQAREEGIRQGIEEGVQQGIEQGVQQGVQQGIEQGVQQGQRLILENFLRVKVGELSSPIAAIVEPLSALPSEELTLFIVQLSQLEGGTLDIQQGQRLGVEKLLQFRFGNLDEELLGIVDSLLILPPQQLKGLLLQLPELSRSELLKLLGESLG